MGQALRNDQTDVMICVRGEMLTPLPEGGLWWAAQRTLIVSDLHLEKGSSFAAAGQMLPPYDTSATLGLVERMIEELEPQRVISLGDSFHDRQAEYRVCEDDAARIRALTEAVDWVWVEGNHDPDPPQHLGGRAAKVLRVEPLVFRHEPTGEPGEVSGHLHPCARVKARGKALRRKCFVTDGQRLVMPSLGTFTGNLNVLHPAFEMAFPDSGIMAVAMGQNRVYPVLSRRLIPDGPRRRGVRRL